MIPHEGSCGCAACSPKALGGVEVQQVDRWRYAAEWRRWINTSDGESTKLCRGESGAPRSPRWTALQAIARTREAAIAGSAEKPPAEAVASALRTLVAKYPVGGLQLEAALRDAMQFGWRLRQEQLTRALAEVE